MNKDVVIILMTLLALVGGRTCSQALAQENSPVIRELIDALRGQDREARWKASMAVGRIGAPAVPALIYALKDGNHLVRIAAANALRDMKAQAAPAVKALAENLKYDGVAPMGATISWIEVRRTAANALAAIGAKALPAVPALVDMLLGESELDDPRPEAPGLSRVYELRGTAAWVLQNIGPEAAKFPGTVPALVAALKDAERMVRLNAAAALKRFGSAAKDSIPSLTQALKHPDQFTRIYAAIALGTVGLGTAPPQRKAIVKALKSALLSTRMIAFHRSESVRLFANLGINPRRYPNQHPY